MKLIYKKAITILLALSIVACAAHNPVAQKFDYSALTILQLQQKMADGDVSSEALTQFYLTQIEQNNSLYNAVIQTNPNAIAIARALDLERLQGKVRGPLHGIPVLLKDNIETLDMPTTAGSLALANNHTKRDATITANLRAAGAVILGKANLSEWANIRSERSSSGWSAVGGQTRNPHDPSRSACGSSSGSGAAVAANFAVATIGTETNGSITCPASVNGIVGMKPTVGLVSRHGIVPISHTQDTAGPMTRSVIDAALILDAIQSPDNNDTATLQSDVVRTDLIPGHSALSPSELKLGWVSSSATQHEAVAALEHAFVDAVRQSGIEVTEPLSHSPYQGFWGDTYTVLLYELKHTMNAYLASLPDKSLPQTLEALIEFNNAHREQEMPYFEQEIFIKSQAKGDLNEAEYQQALSKIREETQTSLKKLFEENSVDALIAITRGPAWKIDLINGDNAGGGVSTYSAVAGYPHITLPLGTVHGMPIGLSVMGLKGEDGKVLKVAQQLESWLNTHPLKDTGLIGSSYQR